MLKIISLTPSEVKREVKYAISRALNDAAFDVRTEFVRQLPERFTIRNRNLERGFSVNKSNRSTLQAEIGNQREYFADQVVGANRTDTAVPGKIRRNQRTMVRRSRWPRSMLSRANVFMFDPSRAPGKGNLHKHSGARSRLVMQRMGRRGKVKVLWALREFQKIKPRFPMPDIAAPVAVGSIIKSLPGHMIQSLRQGAARKAARAGRR